MKHNSRRKKQLRLICIMWASAFLSIFLFLSVAYVTVRSQQELRQLSRQTELSTDVPTVPQETSMPDWSLMPLSAGAESAEPPEPQLLPQYEELYQQNPDLFGWIRIPGTRIDYPVMYTPEEPDKYLYADFQGNYSFAGLPFLEESCSPDSQNLIVYGHNMTAGTMFQNLLRYEQRDFCQRNPTITFNTVYEERTYQVLAAFYDKVYDRTAEHFRFYQFIDPENETEFNEGITYFKEKSLYDSGVTAEYGDRLLTLVTCAYQTENGRFVVVAKLLPENA